MGNIRISRALARRRADAAGRGTLGCGRSASSASGYRARRRRRRDPNAASARERRVAATALRPRRRPGRGRPGKIASIADGRRRARRGRLEGGGARSARRASATASKGAALVDTRTREDASRASARAPPPRAHRGGRRVSTAGRRWRGRPRLGRRTEVRAASRRTRRRRGRGAQGRDASRAGAGERRRPRVAVRAPKSRGQHSLCEDFFIFRTLRSRALSVRFPRPASHTPPRPLAMLAGSLAGAEEGVAADATSRSPFRLVARDREPSWPDALVAELLGVHLAAGADVVAPPPRSRRLRPAARS